MLVINNLYINYSVSSHPVFFRWEKGRFAVCFGMLVIVVLWV